MTIRVIATTVTADKREQLRQLLITKAAQRTFSSAGVLRQLCESNIRTVVSEYFATDRPTYRRRYPGGPRLINSFEAVVVGDKNSFPITVRLQPIARVRNDPDQMAKVASLLYGSTPHEIAPTRGFLKFPWIGYSGHTAPGSAKRVFEAYGTPNIRTQNPVMHPGNRSTLVLEEAAARSVAQLRRRV